MKNSILEYDFLESDDYSYRDYTSKDYSKIRTLDEVDSDEFISYYQAADGDKLERISYEIYGSADYWDLILIVNGIDPLFGMPYGFDLIESSINDLIDQYNLDFFANALPVTHVADLKTIFIGKAITENEELRTIKIIKPTKLHEFLKIARDKGYI